jgi:hypothetical protein
VLPCVCVVLCLGVAACSDSVATDSATGNDPVAVGPTDEGIEAPDVSGEDAADAVSDVEAEELTATLADDGEDDPLFDTSRDPSGCTVTDQDPAAGEPVDDGGEVTIYVDCRQVDWENQDGSDWETFSEAYTAGFDDGCDALFNESPNGSLYEDDYEYTVIDCQNENPGDGSEASDAPVDVPDDPEASGTELGELDGCQALFENQGVASLNYGEQSITEDQCPIGGTATVAPDKSGADSRTAGSASSALRAGDTCQGRENDGTPIVIRATEGKVNCKGAVALLNDWLRRAPKEGVGSGGYVQLYGWECGGAPAAKPNRVGSCRRDGKEAAAFSVTVAPGE